MKDISSWLDRFEKPKSYPCTEEGLRRMHLEAKAGKIGKVIKLSIYAVLIMMFIKGSLSNDFIVTYITGTLTSKTVKFFMRG